MKFLLQKQCIFCKTNFSVKQSHFDKRFCCSQVCRNNLQKVIYLKNNNPNYKGGIPKKQCKQCGKIFTHLYCKERKFCSNKCVGISLRKNVKKNPLIQHKCSVCGIEIPKTRKKCDLCKVSSHCDVCGISTPRKIKRCDKHKIKCPTAICPTCGKEFASYYRTKHCNRNCYSTKGINNSNYKDGRTPLNKTIRNSKEYKDWRNNVFQRDNFSCQECHQVGGTLHAHHIKPFSTHPELRLSLKNGQTLCVECHKKTDSFLRKFKKH